MAKLIFVITILFSVNASAQRSVCDSFLNVLNKQTSPSLQTETALKWTDGGRALFGDSLGYYSQRIVEFGIRKDNYDVQALGFMWLALDFSYSDDNVSGLQIALRALRLAEHNNRPQLLSRGYLVLSFFYDKEQSNAYAKRALDLAIQADELSWQSVAYYTLGMNHLSLLQYDSALYFMQQAYQLSNTLSKTYQGFAQQKVAIPHALGNIHMGLHNMALAKTYFYLALEAVNFNKRGLGVAAANLGLANYYHAENNKDSSLSYAIRAYTFAEALHSRMNQIRSAKLLSQLYMESGNKDSALKYNLIYINAKDSSYSIDKIHKIEGLRFTEQLRQKELEERKEQLRQARRRNIEYVLLGIGLSFLLIFFFLISHTIMVTPGLIKFLGVLILLFSFEFLNLISHPFIAEFTHDSPLWMFLIMVCIATLLVPLHHRLEHRITHQLVEKNKRIRLAAAKKTIAALEKGE